MNQKAVDVVNQKAFHLVRLLLFRLKCLALRVEHYAAALMQKISAPPSQGRSSAAGSALTSDNGEAPAEANKSSSLGLATVLHQHISLLSDHQRSLASVLAAELEMSVADETSRGSSHQFSQQGRSLPSCLPIVPHLALKLVPCPAKVKSCITP